MSVGGTPPPPRAAAAVARTRLPRPIEVFADGACLNNGRRGAAGGYGVFFADGHPENASRCVRPPAGAGSGSGSSSRVTNQLMELRAVVAALEAAQRVRAEALSAGGAWPPPRVVLYTDSMYAISCVVKWAPAWERNGWRTRTGAPVKHAALIRRARELALGCGASLSHVQAHRAAPAAGRGSAEYARWYGNRRADELASQAAALAAREGPSACVP